MSAPMKNRRTTQVSTAQAAPGRSLGLRVATLAGVVVAVAVTGSAAWGLAVDGAYPDGVWAAEALRGGDLVSLVLVTPVLVAGLLLARRGSRAGALLWAGALAYNVYNYGYFVFGARFNDMFLAHVVVLALSGWSLVFLLPTVRDGLPPIVRVGPSPRWEALFLGVVAAVLGGLWSFAILRQAFTGELPEGVVPVDGLHTVYAVDLTFLVSALVVAAVLGWLRTAWGGVAVAVMALAGGLYLVNLAVAQAFQAAAGLDVDSFSPLNGLLVVLFAAAAVSAVRTVHAAAPDLTVR